MKNTKKTVYLGLIGSGITAITSLLSIPTFIMNFQMLFVVPIMLLTFVSSILSLGFFAHFLIVYLRMKDKNIKITATNKIILAYYFLQIVFCSTLSFMSHFENVPGVTFIYYFICYLFFSEIFRTKKRKSNKYSLGLYKKINYAKLYVLANIIYCIYLAIGAIPHKIIANTIPTLISTLFILPYFYSYYKIKYEKSDKLENAMGVVKLEKEKMTDDEKTNVGVLIIVIIIFVLVNSCSSGGSSSGGGGSENRCGDTSEEHYAKTRSCNAKDTDTKDCTYSNCRCSCKVKIKF